MINGTQVKSWGGHGGGVLSLHVTHDGRIASAGRDQVVKVWSPDGNMIKQMEGFADLAMRTTFNHDGTKFVGADWSGTFARSTCRRRQASRPEIHDQPADARRADRRHHQRSRDEEDGTRRARRRTKESDGRPGGGEGGTGVGAEGRRRGQRGSRRCRPTRSTVKRPRSSRRRRRSKSARLRSLQRRRLRSGRPRMPRS